MNKDMSSKKIGNRLKDIRRALKITTYQAADVTGKYPRTIGGYERGELEQRLPVVAKLCVMYDVKVDDVLFASDEDFQDLINDLKGIPL